MTFNGYRVNNLYTMQNIITYFSDCADDLLLNYQDYDNVTLNAYMTVYPVY